MMDQFVEDSRRSKIVKDAAKKLAGGSRPREDFDADETSHCLSALIAYLYNEAIGKVGKSKLRCQAVVVSDIDPEGPEWRSGVHQ